MLKTLEQRKRWAFVLLGISILIATYVAIPSDPFYTNLHSVKNASTQQAMGIINSLNRRELVHILEHVFTFGVIGLLLGAWGQAEQCGTLRLVLMYALIGGLVMEATQLFVHYLPAAYLYLTQKRISPLLTKADVLKDVWGTCFDFAVDGLSAYGAWWISQRHAKRLTYAAIRLRLA